MQIYNQTGFPHEFTMAMDKEGREYLLLVVKGTYDFPDEIGGPVRPSDTQVPLVMADEYTGAPGFSAPLWETDFAHRKPRCDIVLNGAAYAPGGRPATRVRVGVKLGAWSKVLDVLGHREWRARGPLFAATSPEPFLRRPISYDVAWGGTDRLDPDDPLPGAYLRNPVGTGWSQPRHQRLIPGLALPSTQAVGEEISTPFGDYTPMSFGPMGRGWPGRIEHGGTYDRNWIDNIFPFLPPDFDDRYYQMSPPDQQTTPPRGGEEVVLANLTPRGKENFRLPATSLPVTLFKGRAIALEATLLPDTILFDPENRRLCLVWRVSCRIQRTILDFTEAWVGSPTEAMLRARREGRAYLRAAGIPVPEDEDA
ncbi:DUF2169 domain-containing protein [Amaricoccus sp.]|uniref:DUF2169 family type VI secretion system accessory protein n=1 Tax=Amaricoccus sp. TaxID=1872485 RepID=UPI0026235814|nr:DUF2169 domain-containing protein [Amaricoccus sp.]HRO10399.1 DUF2169 domain-containing protein [Amaricoccus sp.]